MTLQNMPLIILGSARSHGNTRQIVDELMLEQACELIDLNEWDFSYYDYEHRNKEDDFLKLVEKMLQHDTLLFASPIYWYSMSAVMKTFFDRLSDLLTIRKALGRQLRGKTMLVLSCNEDAENYDCFAKPFELSADYLGMHYAGYFHTWIEHGELPLESRQTLQRLRATLAGLGGQ